MEAVPCREFVTQVNLGGEEITSPPLLSFCPPSNIEIRIYYSNLLNSVCCQVDHFIFSPHVGNKSKSPWRALNKQNILMYFSCECGEWCFIMITNTAFTIGNDSPGAKSLWVRLQQIPNLTPLWSSVFYLLDFSKSSESVAVVVCISSQLRELNSSIIVLARSRHREFEVLNH